MLSVGASIGIIFDDTGIRCCTVTATGRSPASRNWSIRLNWSPFFRGYAPAPQHFMQWVEEKKYPKEDMCAVGLLKKENNVYRPLFWERLMFPIHDRQGQLVAFGGRRLDEGKPKYINSPETSLFSKKNILYGEHHIRQERPKDIFVVEGYMDVIGLWSKDVQGAVAPLGTAFSAHHGICLWKYHSTPLLCFDGDTAGRKAALRGCQQILGALQPGKSMRIALMPLGQDPDDVVKHEGASKFRALCAKALPLHRFFPQMFFANKAPQGLRSLPPEQKVKIRLELMALTKEIPHTEIQNAYRHAFQHEFYEATRWTQSKKSVTHAISLTHWQRRSEWLLMAAFYHQPWLIKEKLYLLELYHFNDTTLQEVYTLFHTCLEKETDLSKEMVHASFIEGGLSHCVERFCDKDLLRHGIFLQEQKSKGLVLRSWESLWSYVAQLPQLKKDLKDAQRAMTVKVSQENWVRAKHLSTLVEQLKNDTYTQ